MVLKAVLLDFNGIVINDEALHWHLFEELLIEENLRPDAAEFSSVCLGRSDRACLKTLLARRGRVVTTTYLDNLLQKKSERYLHQLEQCDVLPIYPGLEDLIYKIRVAQLKLAVVSGAARREIEWVLNRADLAEHVSVIVAGDDLPPEGSKPAPDGYLLGVEQLNQQYPDLHLTPQTCLAIEDSFAGIKAAKQAGVPVVGVAHSFPYQMIHRRADWVVDFLTELDFEWLGNYYRVQPVGQTNQMI